MIFIIQLGFWIHSLYTWAGGWFYGCMFYSMVSEIWNTIRISDSSTLHLGGRREVLRVHAYSKVSDICLIIRISVSLSSHLGGRVVLRVHV